jgi:thioredoxin reductase
VVSSFPELGEQQDQLLEVAFHRLDAGQFARACSYGESHEVAAGEILFDVGDEDTDLILVDTAIGATPATGWLTGVARDRAGFLLTDVQLGGREPAPLPFETSVPGVFAAGDVRSGSMKRVAAAVGEGAGAVRSVHRALAR